MTRIENEYVPRKVLPPGVTLLETIEALGLSQADLAARTGFTPKHISSLINGKSRIEMDAALRLEKVLGVPHHFWLNLERNYQVYLARIREDASIQNRLSEYREWMRNFPVKEMQNLSWIKESTKALEKSKSLLSFFRINSLDEWDLELIASQSSFRSAKIPSKRQHAIAAWLWMGYLQAQEFRGPEFSKTAFRQRLDIIRAMAANPNSDTFKAVIDECAKAGVILRYVQELPGIGVYGATRWINPRNPLIQLCLRGKTDDQFWFTFFHEAGHVLFHGKSKAYIDLKGKNDQEEEEAEANKFAADFLIPKEAWKKFTSYDLWYSRGGSEYGSKRKELITAFAQSVDISPGIVVGRLQKEGMIRHDHCNELKIKLSWKSS